MVEIKSSGDKWPSGSLLLGLDVGSVSLDTVVLGPEGEILWTDYTRTRGRPLEEAHRVLSFLTAQHGPDAFRAVAVTGSGAPTLAPLIGGRVINEIIALTRGVERLEPGARTIIDMGGEDAKLVLVSSGPAGRLKIDDFAMNTMCAAGTGSFLDQQSHRLGYGIEEFSAMAAASRNPPRLAGRCSVFAKTDMIHLQQEATPVGDIVGGLCFAVGRNLKSNIAKGKKVVPPVVFTGGVAANQGVRRALREIMELSEDELLIPADHACVGALGAALTLLDKGEKAPLAGLDKLANRAGTSRERAARLAPLALSSRHGQPAPEVKAPDGPLQGYLGVDVGSISTNLVVVGEDGQVYSKQYLLTAGQPLEAVKEGLRRIGREIGGRVTILGAGTTGSGRYLTADFIGADIVKNEITAQATAAAAIDPTVDTIFEIGGQDSKYISLKDGAIVDFTMNKVCAAGTGSFLEEQAEKLSINIKGEFGQMALSARQPVKLGERCTVFMESDLVAHQAAGEELENLVAGLSYSIVQNYLNKVVEKRPVGANIFYQGATAANRGIVAAFEAVVGRPITVPPYHDVTGAIGAAILSMRERTWEKSRFKGFDISEAGYEITTFECNGCPNACSVRKVKVEGEKRPLFYGSRCEKYELDRPGDAVRDLPDLFAEREEMLISYIDPEAKGENGVIGIPRAMFYREYLPFFATFLQAMGFKAKVTGPTNKRLIHQGVEVMVNEPCFPLKVAHGHLAQLVADPEVKRILLPSMVNVDAPGHPLGHGQVCPYSQTLPYTAPAAFDLEAAGVEIVTAPLHFGFGKGRLKRDMAVLARRLQAGAAGVGEAVEKGLFAQADFNRRLLARGREVLAAMEPGDLAMVVISRPYNGADPGINLGLPQKMRQMGVWALPMDFLDLSVFLDRPELAEMYWRYGQKILAAGLLTRRDPRLHAVVISNFGCGPDSFIGHFLEQIMEGKPYLEIEIDEHSADVGAVTRLEAFLDSLKNVNPEPAGMVMAPRRNLKTGGRTIFVPPMADHARVVAAAFRATGVPAEVMPESDQRTLELGRRYTSGKECLPCALTTGDMLKILMDDGRNPDEVAFFMPSGTGPCRFGQYHRFHRLALDQAGFPEVPIFAPDQSETLYQELGGVAGGGDFPRQGWRGVVAVDLLRKALLEIRPYENSTGSTDKVYQEYLAKVDRCIESRGDLEGLMQAAAGAFATIPRTNGGGRPIVGVVGEIYTRANRFANDNLVRAVEEFGGNVWMPNLGEWILYTNFCSARRAWNMKRWRSLMVTGLEHWFQKKDERELGHAWRDVIHALEDPSTFRLLRLAGPYMHHTYEGEAILSVGKSRDMFNKGAMGVINVIPFTCMPGTIVTALMKRFREDHGNLPFLPLAMDGQEESGARTRLEAFMHQVKQRHMDERAKR